MSSFCDSNARAIATSTCSAALHIVAHVLLSESSCIRVFRFRFRQLKFAVIMIDMWDPATAASAPADWEFLHVNGHEAARMKWWAAAARSQADSAGAARAWPLQHEIVRMRLAAAPAE